jgi:nitrous oxidase accessory protein NosD
MLRPMTAAAVAALTCLAAAPAKAGTIPVTYVSGKGTNSGTCDSPANPCRTFQFAVHQTAPGGEVKALDPAEYGPIHINKSISITGVEGAGIDTNGGIGINITAPSTVSIANLLIQDVSGSGDFGIIGRPNTINLKITHCTVRGFTTGISLSGPATSFLIADTIVTNNVYGLSAVTFSVGTLDHVVAYGNKSSSIGAVKSVITAVDTIANNNGTGFSVVNLPGTTTLFLARSTAIGNGIGVSISGGATATSFGDNHIKGNGTDVQGPLTNVGTQ